MIELLPYTTKWKDNFNQLRNLLLSVSNNLFLEIAHIGSTAIEMAPAKDIVDVQCAIDSFDKMDQVKSILEPMGFVCIEAFKQDHVPFHSHDYFIESWEKRFFTGVYLDQSFNIHIRLANSLNWKFAEQFKNFMITNSDALYAYMQFKERLASSSVDKESYCIIKDSVIDLLSLQFFKPDEFKK
ncbi:MAG: GrpB family protein [Legionella sp.]|uniref:GrpB family protein n=1 Tax=Legionella sp. TaxID=459 RepID=UPI0039E6DA8F